MTKEQSVICKLLAKALFGKEEEFDGDIVWQDVYFESIRQTVVACVIPAIPPHVPSDIKMKWINASGVHAGSNHRVTEGHLSLHRLLAGKQMPYCILKGLASARYYPDPDMRSLGDVDFIVDEKDADACDLIMKENGFSAEENRLPYEWEYKRGNVEFELHLQVNGVPEGAEGRITMEYLKDIIETSEATCDFGGPLNVPDDFHHGLVILLHTAKHMVGEGVGFRQLADWAVFADRLGEEFPALFEEPLKRIGLWSFCLALSAVCVSFIGMPAYGWIPAYDGGFLRELFDDMIRAGNFRRDGNSGAKSILVEKTDVGGVAEGSMAGQLLKNLGQKVKYKWPVMNRVKILIPFGVVAMCASYGAGMLTGKYEKIDPKELVSEAKKKRQLYGELKLFKREDE